MPSTTAISVVAISRVRRLNRGIIQGAIESVIATIIGNQQGIITADPFRYMKPEFQTLWILPGKYSFISGMKYGGFWRIAKPRWVTLSI